MVNMTAAYGSSTEGIAALQSFSNSTPFIVFLLAGAVLVTIVITLIMAIRVIRNTLTGALILAPVYGLWKWIALPASQEFYNGNPAQLKGTMIFLLCCVICMVAGAIINRFRWVDGLWDLFMADEKKKRNR